MLAHDLGHCVNPVDAAADLQLDFFFGEFLELCVDHVVAATR